MLFLLSEVWLRARLLLHRLRLAMTESTPQHDMRFFNEVPKEWPLDALTERLLSYKNHSTYQITHLKQYKHRSRPATHEFVLALVSYEEPDGRSGEGALILERCTQPTAVQHARSMSDSDLRTLSSYSTHSLQTASHNSSISSSSAVPAYDKVTLAATPEALLLGRNAKRLRTFEVDMNFAERSCMKLVEMANLVHDEFPQYHLQKTQCYFFGSLLYELFTRIVRDTSKDFVPNPRPPLLGRVAFTNVSIGQPPDSVVLALVKLFEERTWPAAVQRINAREQEHAAEIAAATRAADERTRAAEERAEEQARRADERDRAAEERARAAEERTRAAEQAMAEMEAQMEARIAAELARREAARVA
ncbi:hypothetical protein PLICRDRAFT_42451 [Plicaturopsis crispa FD-325 SS-3]|nr:hypothetical protein PLICRDRAFT_42451 [Plicaturopsis crispa FD-325 SS-3]